MSAFAPIILENSVPSNVTFTPSAIDSSGVAKLFDAGDGGFDTRQAISLSVRLPKVGGSVARVTLKVVVPVVNGTTGEKTAECIGTAEFVLPKLASPANRADVLALLAAFLADASAIAAVNNLESIY